MKQCFKCNQIKPISDFYKHKTMKDGHLNKCKECAKIDVRTDRRLSENARLYDRRRYRENIDRRISQTITVMIWNEQNPEAYKAHYLVSNAIRDGRLEKLPCVVCGDSNSHAHHDDYSKPLEVRWLCAKHHKSTENLF
jgi:hypothetical protein